MAKLNKKPIIQSDKGQHCPQKMGSLLSKGTPGSLKLTDRLPIPSNNVVFVEGILRITNPITNRYLRVVHISEVLEEIFSNLDGSNHEL